MGAIDMRQGTILCDFLSMSSAYTVFLASTRRRFRPILAVSRPFSTWLKQMLWPRMNVVSLCRLQSFHQPPHLVQARGPTSLRTAEVRSGDMVGISSVAPKPTTRPSWQAQYRTLPPAKCFDFGMTRDVSTEMHTRWIHTDWRRMIPWCLESWVHVWSQDVFQ